MPKTTVNEDHLPLGVEYEVGLSRQLRPVETVAKAEGMDYSANGELGASVLSPDLSHNLAALLLRQCIHRECSIVVAPSPIPANRTCTRLFDTWYQSTQTVPQRAALYDIRIDTYTFVQ